MGRGDPPMKHSYRKRRDLALKKFSSKKLISVLTEVVVRSGVQVVFERGRPCEVKKEKIISFVTYFRMRHIGYEEMESDSELYLGRHYDHSALHYHYTRIPESFIVLLTSLFEKQIKVLLEQEILLHIFDSTALSTSVRVERTRQGIRKKEFLTHKYHTLLGYDPPNKLVVVEGSLASDHHTSDSKGALLMLPKSIKGYCFGDKAYDTYKLTDETEYSGLFPVYCPKGKSVKKTLSARARRRRSWNGNPKRLYKDIRGTGEVLYGAATRKGLIHTYSMRPDNRSKDALLIGLRQNMLTYVRLKALLRFIRKTRYLQYLRLVSCSALQKILFHLP